ncbi:MAG: hypothetical protein PHR35_01595 [Kiritimatiellae bacterium]|nr:hypothetical protein [Kiritimatiellia bacterium]
MKLQLTIMMGVLMAGAVPMVNAENAAEHPTAKPAAEVKDKTADKTCTMYVCPHCNTMAMQAGKCTGCQKDLKPMHVLGTEDGQVLLCDCGADCKCDAKGIKDGKCACGKEVKKMSCKGMHCCAMKCPKVSDKPGKCGCGMKLKKCE